MESGNSKLKPKPDWNRIGWITTLIIATIGGTYVVATSLVTNTSAQSELSGRVSTLERRADTNDIRDNIQDIKLNAYNNEHTQDCLRQQMKDNKQDEAIGIINQGFQQLAKKEDINVVIRMLKNWEENLKTKNNE